MTSPAVLARLSSSQVHITTKPPPRNLRESKLVLAALQRFGEVSTFRNLKKKYDIWNTNPHRDRTTLAIFETNDAAQRAIACSPLIIPLPGPSPPSEKIEDSPAVLECTIQPSYHNHSVSLKRNPYYSTYEVSRKNKVYHDLKATGIPVRELADTLASKKMLFSWRFKQKLWDSNMRIGAGSLMRLWKEGVGVEGPTSEKEMEEKEMERQTKTEMEKEMAKETEKQMAMEMVEKMGKEKEEKVD